MERIAAFLQDVDSIYDIVWARDPQTGKEVTYGDVRLADELQFSVYNFEAADVEKTWKHLELHEAECQALLEGFATQQGNNRARKNAGGEEREAARPQTMGSVVEEHDFSRGPGGDRENGYVSLPEIRRFPLLPAFDLCLKCSHLFNILDARGAISVTERVGVIARIRQLAVGVAKAWVEQQRGAGDPASGARQEKPVAAQKA